MLSWSGVLARSQDGRPPIAGPALCRLSTPPTNTRHTTRASSDIVVKSWCLCRPLAATSASHLSRQDLAASPAVGGSQQTQPITLLYFTTRQLSKNASEQSVPLSDQYSLTESSNLMRRCTRLSYTKDCLQKSRFLPWSNEGFGLIQTQTNVGWAFSRLGDKFGTQANEI